MWSLTIHGDPVAQARPRFARRGNGVTTYDTKAVGDYKSYAKCVIASNKPEILATTPLCVDLCVFVQKPKSWSRKRIYASTKPDADNFAKLILDCMEGLVYKNDSQIIDLRVRKSLSDSPRVEITVNEIEEADNE